MMKAWEEKVVIPTYEAGEPEKLPVFLEKRVYQGSSGAVYPYPVIESISDVKTDKEYQAVFLENDYLKIMLLPELGGRVQMAYDKIGKRHFIYYNQVIKPALVGLAGPWISGGIEINWPQHHRPSTFMPVDHTIIKNEDGSMTVWMNEMEIMTHQKGMAGYTLYPGKAYLEIRGRVSNRTPFPQTFLWWANPAVAVNDHYQSVFPPDVHAVFDHGKRDVSTFPIATGTYYKVDYSAGVDISNYKNIPVPTSYMAIRSRFNFVGGYENDTKGGVLHVANHHVSPGKKQWTWGNGDFGKAWDRNLTDEDGPYIELMAGVYTDNQPDFSWLQPYEEKTFTQYFLPYRELGVVKNASKDLLINAEWDNEIIRVGVFATSSFPGAQWILKSGKQVLSEGTTDLSPKEVFWKEWPISSEVSADLSFSVCSSEGMELLSWAPEKVGEKTTPEPAKPALLPENTLTNEELYLTGMHLEQYRHATYDASEYYREALRRDPSDIRNNNALGLWLMRRGEFKEALIHFELATGRLMTRNPNPYDGEPLYHKGLCLQFMERWDEAYDSFYKACWNAAWQDVGYFALARISSRRGEWAQGLDEVNRSLIRNGANHQGRHLKALLHRRLGHTREALDFIDESLKMDPFQYGSLFELFFITRKESVLSKIRSLMRGSAFNYEAIALDYAAAGQFEEAIQVLNLAVKEGATNPMTFYYLALFQSSHRMDAEQVRQTLEQASLHPGHACFPNRLEAIAALSFAMEVHPKDGKASYYLGNLWYDKKMVQKAIRCWEVSAQAEPGFAPVKRNLALAAYNKRHDAFKATALMEEAFRLDPENARLLMELDQLYKKTNVAVNKRLELLEKHPALVNSRDDLYLERITLLNQMGAYEQAMECLDKRKFHPWEGGEGKVPAQYQFSRMELAKIWIRENRTEEALRLLSECLVYPPHLGEGKLYGAQENDIHFLMGCAYEASGNSSKAKEYYKLACQGSAEPAAVFFYNDQKPEKIYYQGLALRKMGRLREADEKFDKLISYGENHQNDSVRMDYFAVSLPDLLIWDEDLSLKNRIYCLYLQGLGHIGSGEQRKGLLLLEKAAELDPGHQGIRSLLYNT